MSDLGAALPLPGLPPPGAMPPGLSPTPSPAPMSEALNVLSAAMGHHGYGAKGDGKAAVVTDTHPPVIHTTRSEDDAESHKTVGKVMELFSQARSYRRPIVPMWKRSKRMLYNNHQWGSTRPSWAPSPLVPEILPIAAATVGWMMDQRIGYTVAPTAIPHSDFYDFFQTMAMDLEATMDATWQVNLEENEWGKGIWDAVTYGTGIMKTTWDLTLAGGLGDAISRRVSPFQFYPDPAATCMEDANYFIEVRKMSVQELDRRYPGTADLFNNGEGDTLNQDSSEAEPNQIDSMGTHSAPRANPGAISPVTSPRYGPPGGARVNATDIPGVTLFECWIREHHFYEATDIASRAKIKKVYDTWRVIVIAGDHVIMNEPADNLWSHGKHPYSRIVLWDTSEFWGHSLVNELTPSQVAINRLLAAVQQNIELTGNPIWKDASAGLNRRRNLTNKPGERVTVNGQDQGMTGWMMPPPLNQGMMQLIQYHLQRMEAVSGLAAITKGGTPGGRPAQSVVDSLQEAAFVRVRQYLRYLEYAMRDAGTKRASLIVENYTTPRMMAIAGPSGERTSLALKAHHFLVTTKDGAVPLEYQLSVDAGSRQHTSRGMREDREIQLFTLGAIDDQALLEGINYPNWQTVAKRVEEQRAAEAQAAGQGGGGAGSSVPGARQRAGH